MASFQKKKKEKKKGIMAEYIFAATLPSGSEEENWLGVNYIIIKL